MKRLAEAILCSGLLLFAACGKQEADSKKESFKNEPSVEPGQAKQTHMELLSGGGEFVCVVHDGGLSCFGANTYNEQDIPTLVEPKFVSSGLGNVCAIDNNGVKCWGDGFPEINQVPSLSVPTSVCVGGTHACAIDGKTVACWGKDDLAQATPPALVEPSSLTCGMKHTCAVDQGVLKCWGDNERGQSKVPSLTNVRVASAGSLITCAISDESLSCWGNDEFREPQFIETGFEATPVPDDLKNPRAILVSPQGPVSCVLDDDGAKCWGNHSRGDTYSGALPVADVENPVAVAAAFNFMCSLSFDQGVQCAGAGAKALTVPAGLTFKSFAD